MKKHISLFLLTTSLLLSSCALTDNSTPASSSQEEATTSQTTDTSSAEAISSEQNDSSSEEQSSSQSHQHSWGEGEITTPATCTTDGVKTYTCSGCNETKTEVINKTGHTLEKVEAKEATYFEAGNIEYWHCSVCEKNYSDNTGATEVTNVVVPILDHDDYYTITWKYDDGTVMDVEEVAFGETPSYATPTKAESKSKSYAFNKWTPTIQQATSDATYTASFTESSKASTSKFPDTLYFVDSNCWGDLHAYAYNTSSDKIAAWPGKAMSFVKVNANGERIYSITGVSKYNYIIFSNGTNHDGDPIQTIDISISSLGSGHNTFKPGSISAGKYNVTSEYESGVISTNYTFQQKGQNILHCLDWPLATVLANLDKIADQGFNAVQVSPLQPVKDFDQSEQDTNEKWWRFYQPVGLCIGNKNNNNLFAEDDGKAELKALTKAAARKGIRIVVDVIVNHLADDSTSEATKNRKLSSQVEQYCPDIYNHTSETLHNPNPSGPDYSSAYGITHSDCFGKDLNTANTVVQTYAKNFLYDLVDCGVTGFRFDAAKHIETSVDADNVKSNFWANTLGETVNYAKNTYGRNIWTYGETLAANEHGRYFNMYVHHSWFNAVTPPDDYGNVDVASQNCVLWGESHDNYLGEGRVTYGTSQGDINNSYAYKASWSNEINMLYFVRPVESSTAYIKGSTSVGLDPSNGWQNGFIRYINGRISYNHS